MTLVKIIFISGGAIFGVYLLSKGFNKIKLEGVRFDFRDLFKNVPFKDSAGGLLVMEGILSLIFGFILYLVWF